MKTALLIAAGVAALSVAACNKPAEAPATDAAMTPAPMGATDSAMNPAASSTMGARSISMSSMVSPAAIWRRRSSSRG